MHSLIHALGLLKLQSHTHKQLVVNPRRASYKDLAVYHSKEYLEFTLDKKNDGAENPEFGLQDVRLTVLE